MTASFAEVHCLNATHREERNSLKDNLCPEQTHQAITDATIGDKFCCSFKNETSFDHASPEWSHMNLGFSHTKRQSAFFPITLPVYTIFQELLKEQSNNERKNISSSGRGSTKKETPNVNSKQFNFMLIAEAYSSLQLMKYLCGIVHDVLFDSYQGYLLSLVDGK